jgi:hypothetical protein
LVRTSHAPDIDVVSLKLDRSRLGENFGNLAINSVGQESRLAPYAGMDCFVLGFPEGMNGPGLTPIWKRGSIATEPLYDFRGTPGFLIDTATRKGMSGSPVLARHSGVFRPGGGEEPTQFDVIGTVFRFVGIYSGRLGNDPMEVQLEMVWRDGVLNDITSLRTVGCNPFSVRGPL